MCKFQNCDTEACFGFEGGCAQMCKKHRLEGMINLRIWRYREDRDEIDGFIISARRVGKRKYRRT